MFCLWLRRSREETGGQDVNVVQLDMEASSPSPPPSRGAVPFPDYHASISSVEDKSRTLSGEADNTKPDYYPPPPLGTRITQWKRFRRSSTVTTKSNASSASRPSPTSPRQSPPPLPPLPSPPHRDPHVHQIIEYTPRKSTLGSRQRGTPTSPIFIPPPRHSGVMYSLPPPPRSRNHRPPHVTVVPQSPPRGSPTPDPLILTPLSASYRKLSRPW